MNNTNTISSRNKAHSSILFIIYDVLLFDKFAVPYDVKEVIENIVGGKYDEVDPFIKECVIKALLHEEDIKAIISPFLIKWRYERLPLLTRAIFLASVAKIKYLSNFSKEVVIDNAVKLAKRYLSPNDYRFINAILDKVL